MSRRTLPALMIGLASFCGAATASSQEVTEETLLQPTVIQATPNQRREILADGQTITIISERVIPAANAEIVKEDAGCKCLLPGGEIWQKLLSQELENARLLARVELEAAKFELYKQQMAGLAEGTERELDGRAKDLEARGRELERLLDRERAQMEMQRREMGEQHRALQEQLEVARRDAGEMNDLRRRLEEAQSEIGKLRQEREKLVSGSEKLERAMAEKLHAAVEHANQSKQEWIGRTEAANRETAELMKRLRQVESELEAAKRKLAEQPQEKGSKKKKD